MKQVFLVASGKGGTGKTMFTSNMGAILASAGKRVLLIDLDNGMRNLDLYLGMQDSVIFNLMDVLSGVCGISKAVIRVDGFSNLFFMSASPGREFRDITPLHIEVLCNKLKEHFDYIIFDCPAGMGDIVDAAMPSADKAVIVTEADPAALRDAGTMEQYFMEGGLRDISIVINGFDVEMLKMGAFPDFQTIMENFRSGVAGIIQEDPNIRISTGKGLPIVCKKGTYIEKNFKGIVARIIG